MQIAVVHRVNTTDCSCPSAFGLELELFPVRKRSECGVRNYFSHCHSTVYLVDALRHFSWGERLGSTLYLAVIALNAMLDLLSSLIFPGGGREYLNISRKQFL